MRALVIVALFALSACTAPVIRSIGNAACDNKQALLDIAYAKLDKADKIENPTKRKIARATSLATIAILEKCPPNSVRP